MTLADTHPESVMFVCAERTGNVEPVGTAFLIGVPIKGGWARYFVTAGHVVRSGDPTWIRLRRRDGGKPEDERVGVWVPHPRSDIAITPCDLDTQGFIATWLEEEFFCDKWPPGSKIQLGATIYFMGLLTHVESMRDRAVPMMRTGAIGALYVEEVPMRERLPDGTEFMRKEPVAHLVDCYSRSGFSGSPVYVEHPIAKVHDLPNGMKGLELTSLVALFGVLVGHFGSTADNAGVAVVVPIDAIRELLTDNRLVTWQREKEREMEKKRDTERDENAAEVDRAATDQRTEFERFEELTQKLVNTPKPGKQKDES